GSRQKLVRKFCYLSCSGGCYQVKSTVNNDWALLNQFATNGSEDAFATLVERYGSLVYHAALREVGDPYVAEEVSQIVFIALARKSRKLPQSTILSGWLFRATRFAVRNLTREETRRRNREEKAFMESIVPPAETESIWAKISPHLNDAMDMLSKRERDAVLIRFFGEKTHRQVADALGISEDAAKMTVSRAVEKLRRFFVSRSLVIPSVALLAAFSAHSVQAVPLNLTSSLVAVAVGQGSGATTSALTTAKGIL